MRHGNRRGMGISKGRDTRRGVRHAAMGQGNMQGVGRGEGKKTGSSHTRSDFGGHVARISLHKLRLGEELRHKKHCVRNVNPHTPNCIMTTLGNSRKASAGAVGNYRRAHAATLWNYKGAQQPHSGTTQVARAHTGKVANWHADGLAA